MQVLAKSHFVCNNFSRLIPEYIQHPHLDRTKMKLHYHPAHLIDESENSSDGMIKIMQQLHSTFVPRNNDEHPEVLESVDFAGDVLTNKRAFAAQISMRNGSSSFENLSGLNHRPGGLHIIMNLTLVRGIDCMA